MSLLDAKALAVGYGRTVVASGIDLALEPGHVTALIGPNGVGKTTLFRTLLGLLPPLAGAIALGGMPLARMSRPAIARQMAYVPQAGGGVAHTVLDLVLMGRTAALGLFATPGPSDVECALRALDRLGIVALAQRESTRISGGQRQLALIARALAQDASVVIMDEPGASLDLGNRLRVLDTIRRLATDGLAVLVSTHEPEQAFAVADRVAILGAGEPFASGPAEALLTSARLSRLYGRDLIVETTPSGRRVVGSRTVSSNVAPGTGS